MTDLILPVLLAAATIVAAKPGVLPPLPEAGTDARPTAATSLHNLSEMWMTVSNVGLYGDPWGGFTMQWPGGEGSTYLYLSSIWASAFGAVSPGGVIGAYVSSSYTSLTDFEFWPTEGYPMMKLTPGPTALEESSWGEDDWYAGNYNPIGIRTFQRAYSWSTPGYDQFLVNDITVTHQSEHGNPGIPLDAFCFSVMADLDVASTDPSSQTDTESTSTG